ncbi:TonB-dependent receptor plug domain-containing protein [Pseudorhodoferax sp.]|uniref:TonB-dependent receptor plug domain-containing protein n=1 Tax=Pseudorhodoferax sp. TaxID=1993553 RepID=UPI002DD656C7|nr:TonB-dependent receptor [Pseudorhodoferax sp.]
MPPASLRPLAALFTVFCLAAPALAAPVEDLLALDFQRLLDVKVSSATRNEESAFGVPAALFVLGAEDIRRSGHRHLAELLRDVPGLHVGRFDGNKWAIASRSALSRFASTLLVMIDGRPVYTPLTGGVRWEVLNLPLSEIERIEVIRGPGGPLWGANAVDGIISVVTRAARDLQGPGADLALGSRGDLRSQLALHQGWALGPDLHARVTAQRSVHRPGVYAPAELSSHRGLRTAGAAADDAGWSEGVGLRLDGQADAANRWSLQLQRSRARFSEERASTLRPPLPNRMRYDNGFALGEWQTQAGSARGVARLSIDALASRDDILRDDQRMIDLDLQWSDRWQSHQWTVGAGWRDYDSQAHLPISDSPCVACFGVWPPRGGSQTLSLFAQDQWLLSESLQATLGAKLENYRPGGHSVQPTLRLAWTPAAGQTAWLAATRAVRAPTRLERDRASFNVPPAQQAAFGCWGVDGPACLLGDPQLPLWTAKVLEAGWRARLSNGLDLDLSLFDSRYEGVRGTGIGFPQRAPQLHGAEASLRWQVQRAWSLHLGGSWQEGSEAPTGQARTPMNLLPRRQWLLQSRWSPLPDWDLDLRAEQVAERRRAGLPALPAYWRVDARLAWRPAPGWEASLTLQRLNNPLAVEYFESLKVNTVGTRGALLALRFGL